MTSVGEESSVEEPDVYHSIHQIGGESCVDAMSVYWELERNAVVQAFQPTWTPKGLYCMGIYCRSKLASLVLTPPKPEHDSLSIGMT
jgi:hypothetical protein